MKRIILSVILPAGLLASVAVGVALATPGSGITTVNLSVGRFGEIDAKTETETHEVELRTKGQSDVYVVSNTFAPGGSSGWHTHPGPSLITVKSGTITAYDGDDPNCTPHVYPAGTGLVDPGGDHVHLLRNEGSVQAETIAVQILPAGAARRIDAPDPGNCPF
jgi:quercetin dioxygenase-like cupin family protein